PSSSSPDLSGALRAVAVARPHARMIQIQDLRGFDIMTTFKFARAMKAALIAAALGGASSAALADIKDYKFELVDPTVQEGADRVVTVRLLDTRTGKPVPDAVVIASRLDMSPDGMGEMATKVTPVPGAEP